MSADRKLRRTSVNVNLWSVLRADSADAEARNPPRDEDSPHAFRLESTVSISAMSFGSLSAAAIEALNKGAAMAGCLHNTGEGSISPYHDFGIAA